MAHDGDSWRDGSHLTTTWGIAWRTFLTHSTTHFCNSLARQIKTEKGQRRKSGEDMVLDEDMDRQDKFRKLLKSHYFSQAFNIC